MPVYKVEAPDGQIIKVEAPEGASQADILAFAEENYKPKAPEPKESVLRQAADIPVNFAKGISQGVRMLSDAFGADNAVSSNLRGVEDYLGNLLSAQAKNDQQAIAEIFKEAEDKGVLDQVKAGLKAFATAPVDIMSQAFGTIIPTLAGGLAGKVIGIGARAAGVGTGAVMGTGAGKSSIYDAVTEELKQAGLPPEAIQQAATQAQEYGGKNLDLILANTLLGGVAAGTGIERALIPGMVKNMSANIAKRGALGRGLATGAPELLTEGAQGGTEQLSQNVALQREGFDVPTFRGVGTATTMEAVAGGVLGGGIGAFSRPQATPVAPPAAPPAPDAGLNAIPAQDFTAPPAEPFVPQVVPQQFSTQQGVDLATGVQGGTGLTQADFLGAGEAAVQPGQRERAQALVAQQFGLNANAPRQEYAPAFPDLAAAQQSIDGTRFQQQTPAPAVTPAQTIPRTPTQPLNAEQMRQRVDEQSALVGQMQNEPFAFDRNRLSTQADVAGGTGQVRGAPQARLIDPNPMPPRAARQRLAVLKDEIASQGGDADELNIVPHPTMGGRFAIEQRASRQSYIAPPIETPTISRAEAQQRIEGSALQGSEQARLAQDNPRQAMISRAMSNIEARGGVASPYEAQLLLEANMGRPYNSVDNSLAQVSKEPTPNLPKESVTKNQQLAAAQNAEAQARSAVEERQRLNEQRRQMGLKQLADDEQATAFLARRQQEAEQRVAQQQQQDQYQQRQIELQNVFGNLPPNPREVVSALSTPSVNRNAQQIKTVQLAQTRMTPNDFSILEMVADNPNSMPNAMQRIENEHKVKYSLSNDATPELKATVDEMRKKLLPILKRFGLGNVGLRLIDSIENGKADGMYAKQVITLALDADNPMGVMRHEVIHALKELGAFTPAEWKVLSKAAKDTWINQFFNRAMQDQYQEVYLEQNGNLDGFQEYLQEEAIAQAFRFFTDTKPPSGMIANLMRRLNIFFDALGNFLTGKGFRNIDEMFLPNRIFADIERGAIQPGRAQGRKEEMPVYAFKPSKAPEGIPQDIYNLYRKYERMTAMANGRIPAEPNAKGVSPRPQDLKREETMSFRRVLQAVENLTGDRSGEPNAPTMKMLSRMSELSRAEDEKAEETGTKFSLRSLNPVMQGVAEEVGLTPQEILATSLPLQTGLPGDAAFEKKKLKGIPEVVRYLEDRRRMTGVPLPELDVSNEADRDTLAKLITAEAMAAIRAGGNAIDWYDGVINKTMAVAAVKYPELSKNENAKTAFKLAMAITSQGMNVEDNIKFASNVYEQYRKNNKFPEIGTGGSAKVMKKSFALANDMVNAMGMDTFREFLQKPFTVKDIENLGFKVAGELKSEKVLGSIIFGSKIGFGFYSNLSGNFDPVTMDMWFMRTIGRLTGTLKDFDPARFEKQVTKLRNSLDARGKNGIFADSFDKDLVELARTDDDAAVELARKIISAHEKDYKVNRAGFDDKTRNKTALVLSAYPIIKSMDKPIDAPGSGGVKSNLRKVFAKVRENVKNIYGADIPSAALQALIWYPEQSLYKQLGVKLRVTNQDYAGAMQKLLKQEGYNEQRISAAVKSAAGRRKQVSGKPNAAAEQTTGTEGSGTNAKFSLRDFGSSQSALRPSPSSDAGISFNPVKEDAVSFQGSHYGKARTEVLNGAKYGQGLKGAEARRLEQSDDDRIKRRVYFYIPRGNNTMPNREAGVGSYVYTQKLDNILAPGPTMGRLNKEAGGDANKFESLIVDNGYDGYAVPDFGMMVVLNQDVPVKYEGTVDELQGGKKPQQKFSLRAPTTPEFKRFFGNSKITNPDGTPKVMYHGTARIIDEFIPKQANAIFVTDNPDFAESFSDDSLQFMITEQMGILRKAFKSMTPDDQLALVKKAYKFGVKQKGISRANANQALAMIEQEFNNRNYSLVGDFDAFSEFFAEEIKNKLESGQNIMPLYVRAENPFDYENPKHIKALQDQADNESLFPSPLPDDLKTGSWKSIESNRVQELIKEAGFDGFYVKEGGNKNLAVYNPNQIKSAIGNRGTYDETGRILYSLKNAPPNQYTKLTEDPLTEKTINGVIKSAFNAVSNDGTSLRNALVDKFSQLSKTLSSLPLFNNKGELRGDMLLHSYAQATNLIKAGLVSGTPILNKDGTIGIERSDNNLANAERLADLLDTNKNVVESGLTGRGYIANIARNLRGADIIAEDRAAQQLGAQQLARANQMYADLNAEIKTGKLSAAAIAKRQKEINKLRKEGKENSRQKRELQVKPEDIAWAEKQLQMTPEVQAILDIWKEVNTSLVNLYESTGMIDKETADKYRGQKNYVPLFKSREDLNEEAFFRTGTSPKTASKLKELKGADITRNIWENVTKQYAVMTAAAYENQTRRVSVEQMRSINPDLAQITTKDDPRVNLRFRKDGEDVHAIIENPNDLAAFQSMTYQFGPVMQFFGGFTRLLRAGALINPMFWLRQLIRDPISVSLTGQAGVVTPFHSAKEFINILARNSEEARVLASRGVIGQFDTTLSLNEFLGNVGKDKQAAPGLMQKSIQRLMEIHEASDAATRVSVYKKAKAKALKDGMSEAQAVDYAVFKARESINFALTGNSPALAAARQLIPFLNATIVGLDTLYRAATGYGLSPEEKAKAKSAFRNRAAIMVMMSVAYAALMSDDEEYNKLPDYVKDGNWLFPIIGLDGKKKFIKIPVPYEVGYLFKTLPEVAIRYLNGNSTGKEVAKSISKGLIQNLPTGGTPIPQFAKPALEVVTNYSFFTGRPIESMGDERLLVAERGRKTSEISKALSKAGLDEIGLSPAKLDTLTKGYFAEFGNFFNELADAVIAVGSGKERTAKDLEDLPFFKSFMADPQADKAVSTFYDHQKTANEVANSFSKMKGEGRVEELQALIADPEKRQMVVAAPALRKIGDVMSTLNKQITIIDRDQSKSPAERRQLINELERKRNEIANRGVQIARELGL